MKARRIFGLLSLTFMTAFVAVILYAKLFQPKTQIVQVEPQPATKQINLPAAKSAMAIDFIEAADKSVHAVVHVMTTEMREARVNPLYEWFYGVRPEAEARPVMGYGSGVIITDDGYIVTNNHVVEGSDEIKVTLNDRREYTAKLIGNDPTTDLALLKIDESGLPTLSYGNSNDLRLGEWVLAVGNPYNLTSTVTAGIVSAKARNINILPGEFSIEAYIQTDAAVNPGNSGGALVNTAGDLVGINAAIASRTGNYTGYSFAIPVSIVKKVVSDLMEFGEVQRALLGVVITDVTSELAEKEGLKKIEGVYISELSENGAAKDAGIKEGDVILSINGVHVNTGSELQEQVGQYRPNDLVKVDLKRKGELKQFDVRLRNTQGGTEIVRSNEILEELGATFVELSSNEKEKLGITSGLRVSDLRPGKFMKVGIKKGFIITSVNKTRVNSVKDITNILRGVEGGVIIEGVYSDGSKSYYAFGM